MYHKYTQTNAHTDTSTHRCTQGAHSQTDRHVHTHMHKLAKTHTGSYKHMSPPHTQGHSYTPLTQTYTYQDHIRPKSDINVQVTAFLLKVLNLYSLLKV